METPQRILILGPGGAGKSTLARQLASRLDLPLIHLDQHHWQPGWVPMEEDRWPGAVEALSARERWVMDGNYAASLPMRLSRADLVIVLEASRLKSIWRAFTRVVKTFGRVRPDMAPGCPERFSLEFFVWLWNFPRDTKPQLEDVLARHGVSRKIIRLRTDSDIRAFLHGC